MKLTKEQKENIKVHLSARDFFLALNKKNKKEIENQFIESIEEIISGK